MPKPTIFNWAKNPDGSTGFVPDMHYKRDALVKCDATGSAAVVIHRSVFERINAKTPGRWYTQIQNPDTGLIFSEDLSFCLRCAEHEIPIHVDTSIKTTHLKPVWLSQWHHEMALAAAEAERAADRA